MTARRNKDKMVKYGEIMPEVWELKYSSSDYLFKIINVSFRQQKVNRN